MTTALDNLPDSFSKDDKDNLEFILSLKGSIFAQVHSWLNMLTNQNAIEKLKKTSLRLSQAAGVSLDTNDIIKETSSIKNQLDQMAELHEGIGLDVTAKVFKSVSLEMICAVAEFNLASDIHDKFLRENYVHKTN